MRVRVRVRVRARVRVRVRVRIRVRLSGELCRDVRGVLEIQRDTGRYRRI